MYNKEIYGEMRPIWSSKTVALAPNHVETNIA